MSPFDLLPGLPLDQVAGSFQRLLEEKNREALRDEDMTLQQRLENNKGVVENLQGFIGNFYVRDDPQFSVEAFEKLVRWVDNSLDIYRVSPRDHAMQPHATSCSLMHTPRMPV